MMKESQLPRLCVRSKLQRSTSGTRALARLCTPSSSLALPSALGVLRCVTVLPCAPRVAALFRAVLCISRPRDAVASRCC